MKETTKKVAAAIGIAALGAAGIGLGFALDNPTPEVIVKEIPKEVIKEVTKEVQVEVPVEVIKEVEVPVEVLIDNGKLDLVLDHIYDNDGKVEYLTENLDDDEVSLIADRVIFVNDIKKLAADYVKEELADEVDKMSVSGETLDEDDIERIRIDDDSDEIVIDDIDFEDKDADVVVTGSFEQDDIEYEFEAVVEIKDGEVDEIDSIDVWKA
jgi:hypothetical protein